MSTRTALRKASRTARIKDAKDKENLNTMRQEISNLQETLMSSLKKHVSNITLYMLFVILAQKIIPKGVTLYNDTPSLYANWTAYNNGQNLNQEIRTAIDNKTLEMSAIAVELMAVRGELYEEDFERAKQILVMGHDCLTMVKRLKTNQGIEMDNLESIKQLDRYHKKLERLNKIRYNSCGGTDKTMLMNIVHEAISDHDLNKATFNHLLRVHKNSLCRLSTEFTEQFCDWFYFFMLFAYSLYGMFALGLARINVEYLNNWLLHVYFRLFFWGLFSFNMYHHAPWEKYWYGEYGLWGLAWAIFDECGFTKIDYSSYAFYEQFVLSFTSAYSTPVLGGPRPTPSRSESIPDNALQPALENHFNSMDKKKEEQEKSKEKSKTWQEILYQCCILGEKQRLKSLLDCHSAEIKINKPQDISGNTPLHLAILGNHLSSVQILMVKFGKKIDGTFLNQDGHNALDLAIIGKNANIITTLLEYYKPSLSSLALAVQHDEVRWVRDFMPKLQELYDPELVQLVVHLSRFCSLTLESKRKDLRKERKKAVNKNREAYKKIIVETLKNFNGKQKMEKLEKPEPDFVVEKNERLINEFECPVCSEVMVPPLQIFACSNDHFICSICVLEPTIKECPICREDFKKKKPQRRLASERHLEILLGNGLL